MRPQDHLPGTFFWLKVRFEETRADELRKKYDRTVLGTSVKANSIMSELSHDFVKAPEYQSLDILMQRVEAFDLAADPPWYSIALSVAEKPSDDLRMLLILKYDVNYEHRHHPPSA